jgi:hypothetical protein
MVWSICKPRVRLLIEATIVLSMLPIHLYAAEAFSGIAAGVDIDTSGDLPVSSEAMPPGEEEPKESAPKSIEPSRDIRIQLPGFSHHFSAPAAAKYGKKWNEQNYGIGVEMRDPMPEPNWAGWSTLDSAGLMKDSLGVWGGYAGVALQKRLVDNDYTLDLGPSFWLLWRTFDFGGPHMFVPAILPSLSIEHRESGWGLNSVLIPGFRWHTREMPTVLWVGITKSY